MIVARRGDASLRRTPNGPRAGLLGPLVGGGGGRVEQQVAHDDHVRDAVRLVRRLLALADAQRLLDGALELHQLRAAPHAVRCDHHLAPNLRQINLHVDTVQYCTCAFVHASTTRTVI